LPITVAQAKVHLNMPDAVTKFDSAIENAIKSARGYIEAHTWQVLNDTTFKLYLDEFPELIEISKTPLIEVSSIEYVDSDGVTQTLSSSEYRVDLVGGRIEPDQTFPATKSVINAVTVTFKAGYIEDSEELPSTLLSCVYLLTEHFFRYRGAIDTTNMKLVEVPYSLNVLLGMSSKRRF
jgi:uncharacterized phiE125 gp8 family phage protein